MNDWSRRVRFAPVKLPLACAAREKRWVAVVADANEAVLINKQNVTERLRKLVNNDYYSGTSVRGIYT